MLKCPQCKSMTGDNDEFCSNCGFNLISSKEYNLLKNVNNVLGYSNIVTTEYTDPKRFPLLVDFASDGKNLEGYAVTYFLEYLCYLGLGDGYISNEELDFINFYLDFDFTRERLMTFINTHFQEDISQFLPLTFMLFHEIDLDCIRNTGDDFEYTDFLLLVYEDMGKLFIACDGKITDEERNLYNHYMDKLTESLMNYKNGGYDQNVKLLTSRKNGNQNINYNFSQHSNDVKVNNPNITIKQEHDDETLEDSINELNKLIGLESVKNDVNSLINLIQVRRVREQRGMKQPPMSLHLVFSGNPGTGKTTVARLLSKIYHKMGLLSKGHLIETDRSGLVGGYIGQTAIKTQEVIQKAMGGILFIDEAYTLSSSKGEQDYGQESIDTILKAMEDNRADLIVIVAGYPDLMQEFLQSNPGLQSRFNKFIYFEDYNPEELYKIFKSMCDENHLILEDKADEFVKTHFVEIYNNRGDNFANGREVRNLFENVLGNQANRIASNLNISDEELNTLKYEDFK